MVSSSRTRSRPPRSAAQALDLPDCRCVQATGPANARALHRATAVGYTWWSAHAQHVLRKNEHSEQIDAARVAGRRLFALSGDDSLLCHEVECIVTPRGRCFDRRVHPELDALLQNMAVKLVSVVQMGGGELPSQHGTVVECKCELVSLPVAASMAHPRAAASVCPTTRVHHHFELEVDQYASIKLLDGDTPDERRHVLRAFRRLFQQLPDPPVQGSASHPP